MSNKMSKFSHPTEDIVAEKLSEYTLSYEQKKKRLKQKEIGRRQKRNRVDSGKRASTRSRDPY